MVKERKATSVRAEGHSSIGVSKVTRSMLKQLAGSTPVSDYVRALAERELGKKQGVLPGQEKLVSPNTIASVKADTSAIVALATELKSMALRYEIGERRFEALLTHVGKCVEFEDKQALIELRAFIKTHDKLKVEASSQAELKLELA